MWTPHKKEGMWWEGTDMTQATMSPALRSESPRNLFTGIGIKWQSGAQHIYNVRNGLRQRLKNWRSNINQVARRPLFREIYDDSNERYHRHLHPHTLTMAYIDLETELKTAQFEIPACRPWCTWPTWSDSSAIWLPTYIIIWKHVPLIVEIIFFSLDLTSHKEEKLKNSALCMKVWIKSGTIPKWFMKTLETAGNEKYPWTSYRT